MHEDTLSTVAVIGLGHTGLPMAVEYAKAGHQVTAFDINRALIQQLDNGVSHIKDVDSTDLAYEDLYFTSDADLLMGSNVFIVCVPTSLNGDNQANLSNVIDAIDLINASAGDGAVVILQSTVPVGITRELRGRIQADVAMGYCPERINPGSKAWGIRNTPRLVSSIDRSWLNLIIATLSPVCAQLRAVSSVETAELAKLWENTFRAVNIAAVHELQSIASKYQIKAADVIDAAATKPYGFMRFNPGAGPGGDCIPTDPWMLLEDARPGELDGSIIHAALSSNRDRPWKVAQTAKAILRTTAWTRNIDHTNVLVLGMSYKPGVNDTRNSPGMVIAAELMSQGITVDYCDPIIAEVIINQEKLTRVKWSHVPHGHYDLIVMANADGEWCGSPEGFTLGDTILDPHGILQGDNIYGVN